MERIEPTVFLRGVFAHCEECATELHVQRDVELVVPHGTGLQYRTHCPGCGHHQGVIVDLKLHQCSVNYLRQTAQDRRTIDLIIEPLTEEENLLAQWANALDQMGDTEILKRLSA